MDGKTVAASAISDHVIEVVPDDLNPDGLLLEGRIMQIVNAVALKVARRHAGCSCTAAGIDAVRFFRPATYGDLLICKASVNRTWNDSLEVGIKVIAEDFRTLEQKDIFSAYFTFNAIDEELLPIEIAPVIPETPEQIQRFHDANWRRKMHRVDSNRDVCEPVLKI